MTTAQYKALQHAMEKNGWLPLRDIFGSIYEWKFRLNGKTISNKLVEQHWLTYGLTPVPF